MKCLFKLKEYPKNQITYLSNEIAEKMYQSPYRYDVVLSRIKIRELNSKEMNFGEWIDYYKIKIL